MSAIPEDVARLKEIMTGFTGTWALCGGWAIDSWLGGESRQHSDIDIVVFQDELPVFFEHFTGWDMVAHDETVYGGTDERWNGRPLVLPGHIHMPAVYAYDNGRIYSEDGFDLDVQVNERCDGAWVLNEDPLLIMPLTEAIIPSPWGLPMTPPELVLFYKTGEQRRRKRDQRDFEAVLPRLSPERHTWLRDAIAAVRSDHEWLLHMWEERV